MPELPEVETIKNDLRQKILKKEIKKVSLRLKKIVKSSARTFASDLEGNIFTEIERRGKLLIFALGAKRRSASAKKYLLIHLRMTGQLIYRKNKEIVAGGHSDNGKSNNDIAGLPNRHTHIIFSFSDGSQLFFNDLRRFGVAKIVGKKDLEKITRDFGAEPLEKNFSLKAFRDSTKSKSENIKAFLLNQKYIAGIGNIYADEILFEAGVLPGRKIVSLKTKEVEAVYKAIKKILKKAIKYRGTTFSDYADGRGRKGNFTKFLKVYKREGDKCSKCGKSVIKKTKVAGRGTRYCEKCQK